MKLRPPPGAEPSNVAQASIMYPARLPLRRRTGARAHNGAMYRGTYQGDVCCGPMGIRGGPGVEPSPPSPLRVSAPGHHGPITPDVTDCTCDPPRDVPPVRNANPACRNLPALAQPDRNDHLHPRSSLDFHVREFAQEVRLIGLAQHNVTRPMLRARGNWIHDEYIKRERPGHEGTWRTRLRVVHGW